PALLARYARKLASFDHVASNTLREDESFEQRVRGQPIRAVYAGARHFAARVEPIETCPSAQIRDDPAHHVVSSRGHRNQIGRRVYAARATNREDPRTPLLEALAQH